MNITKIKNYVAAGNISRIKKSVGKFCTRADKLADSKPAAANRIPNPYAKCEGTGLTLDEIIALILRNA